MGRTVGGREEQANVQSSIANQMLPDWKGEIYKLFG